MEDKFGQTVTRSDADRYFANFYNIKKRSQKKIKAALKGDKEALRYYCGDPRKKDDANKTKKGENQDWAFVFDEQSMKRLMAKMKKEGGNCIFFFNAATDEGRPTVVLVPAKYQEPAAYNVEEHAFKLDIQPPPKKSAKALMAPMNAEDDDGGSSTIAGEQHPGYGGGNGFQSGETVAIPKGFSENEYGTD